MSEEAMLPSSPGASAERRLRLRYAGTCRLCGAGLPTQAEALYERVTRTVRCLDCHGDQPASVTPTGAEGPEGPPQVLSSTAGSSARREYERRRAKDEERLREKWGSLGELAVTLSTERQSTVAWQRGAAGEERLGARLDGLVSPDVVVLHDRRIPGSRANIDHIVVTRGRIWVIDAKRYRGRPVLRVEGGLLRPRTEKLLVGRRNCTKLVDGVLHQLEAVLKVVGALPVTGALCFVDADWPVLGGSFTTRGVHVLWPKRLAKHISQEQGDIDVAATSAELRQRLRPA